MYVDEIFKNGYVIKVGDKGTSREVRFLYLIGKVMTPVDSNVMYI